MSGASAAGTFRPIARATSPRQISPLRRHSRACTSGTDPGDSDRYSAAESSTASSDTTQELRGLGERNRTSGRYVVWLSATSAAQASHRSYRSGSVSMVDRPEPSA